MTQPPQTGDPVVDEVINAFHDTDDQPLAERAEAALEAQRLLQGRLTESAPGNAPGPAHSNTQGNASASAMARVAGTGLRA